MTITRELRFGAWEKALADVQMAPVWMSDPPYSKRTHEGQRSVVEGAPAADRIEYPSITEGDAHKLVLAWTPRVTRWAVLCGDEYTCRWYQEAFEIAGWHHWQVPWMKTNPAPRIDASGPTQSAEYIVIARPVRRLAKVEKRFRPGHYIGPAAERKDRFLVGQKPLWLMRALVRDYSEPGDLIIDTHAGSGTTLAAAALEGRSSLGAEKTRATHTKAAALLGRPVPQSLL